MAKGFKQAGNVENKNEEDKVPIIDNKNIVSTSNMNTMPLSQSTSLKFGKGLGMKSTIPMSEEKNSNMNSEINVMPKSKELKSTFGRASVSNNAPTECVAQQGKGLKSTFGQPSNTNATYTENNTQQAANFRQTTNSNVAYEPTRESYDETLSQNVRRKKHSKKAFIAIIAAVAAVVVIAFGLLNVPYFKPTGYILSQSVKNLTDITSATAKGVMTNADINGDKMNYDFIIKYNDDLCYFGFSEREENDSSDTSEIEEESYARFNDNNVILYDSDGNTYSELANSDFEFVKASISELMNYKDTFSDTKKEYINQDGTKYYKITTQFDDKALDTYKNSTSNDALKPASTTIYINAKTYLPEAMEMDLTDIFSVIDDTVYEGRTGVAYVSLNVSFVDYNSTQVILPKGDLSNSSSNKKSDDKSSQTDTTQSIFADKDYDYDIYSYDFDSDYYEAGLSCVYKVVEKNGENQFKYGYVDENKNIVIPCKYDDWSNVYGGEFLILKKEGKYGVLDTQGRTVLDFNYDEIFYDEGNTFTVKTGNKQEKIDTTDIIRWAK